MRGTSGLAKGKSREVEREIVYKQSLEKQLSDSQADEHMVKHRDSRGFIKGNVRYGLESNKGGL